jgi:hypothetical protein
VVGFRRSNVAFRDEGVEEKEIEEIVVGRLSPDRRSICDFLSLIEDLG